MNQRSQLDPIVLRVDSQLQEFVSHFLAGRHSDIHRLESALSSDDLVSVASIGRDLKEVGSSYGFHFISDCGAAIETAAAESDRVTVGDSIRRLRLDLARTEVVAV